MICGCPRTGTALATAMLFRQPQIITVMEPWDAMRMAPAPLFKSLRAEILAGTLRRGRLDYQALVDRGEVKWCRDGEKPFKIRVDQDFYLGIKFPSFWRYLEFLPQMKFVVCVRDPLEVVRSFRRQGGRLAKGLDYDIAFNRNMNEELILSTSNELERCVLMYEYVCSRLIPSLDRQNVFMLKYERWFSEPTELLSELGEFLGVNLGEASAVIRPPSSGATSNADPEEVALRELIRFRCPSAARLGYEV